MGPKKIITFCPIVFFFITLSLLTLADLYNIFLDGALFIFKSSNRKKHFLFQKLSFV